MEIKVKGQRLKIKVSAIVLIGGKYSQELLKKCLNSVAWADEVIEVETDKLKGSFADWRNLGAKKANSDWLLYVDSDEQVIPELKKEILFGIQYLASGISAYAIPRRNFIFGKEFKHSGQYPDYVKRLFKKDKFNKWTGDLHEEPEFEGELGRLKNPLIHNKHDNLSDMVAKTNEWSEIEAKLMYQANHPKMNIIRFFSAMTREFWLRMIKQTAFLDGVEGVIYAIYQVFSKSISYAKLWEIQINESRNI